MDYYDGNTVTALWNYAQHFTMSDNSYSTQFGPSTPGALNLVSGNTTARSPTRRQRLAGNVDNGTAIGNGEPFSRQRSTEPRNAAARRRRTHR